VETPTWTTRRDAHARRVDAWILPHLERRRDGVAHPVEDFLFTYYSQRPATLRRWHPGYGVRLTGPDAETYRGLKGYAVTARATDSTGTTTAEVTREHVVAQRPLLEGLHRLLTATAARPAQLGCFGMHEWAMVYRLPEGGARHAAWPLRLGPAGTDTVVESHRIT